MFQLGAEAVSAWSFSRATQEKEHKGEKGKGAASLSIEKSFEPKNLMCSMQVYSLYPNLKHVFVRLQVLGFKRFSGRCANGPPSRLLNGPADRFPGAARVSFLKPPHLLCTYTILNYKIK